MRTIFIFIFIGCLLVSGCTNNKRDNKPHLYYSGNIQQLVLKAVNGDSSANAKLDQLVDFGLPTNNNYNQFKIDSLTTQSGKKFYTVLLSFPNPIYNRFAVYDNSLRLYLLDKSLNGDLRESKMNIKGHDYVQINEKFLTKDILKLDRVSLYQLSDTSANLVFRSFTKLEEPGGRIFTQTITEISPDRIKTSLNSSKYSLLRNKADIFEYDTAQKKYVSQNLVFYNFIKSRIDHFKKKLEKPELTGRNSALTSVGINPNLARVKRGSNNDSFSISLTDDWAPIKNIVITQFLKKRLTGTKFINNLIGASISVVMIPPQDSAEQFLNADLNHIMQTKYKIRYSDTIPMRKDFIQFFEYSCGTKKYLLIFQASKYTYDKYKPIYENIIKSFSIDC